MTKSVNQLMFQIGGRELTMPSLLKRGYQRVDVNQLFQELSRKNFGEFIPGKRGPGCCSRFLPNDNCPNTYILFTIKGDKESVVPKEIVKETLKEDVTTNVTDAAADADADADATNSSSEKAVSIVGKKKTKKNVKKIIDLDYEMSASVKSQVMNSLWHLSKNIVEDEKSTFVGYVCSIFDNKILTIHRVRGGGKKTMGEALQDVWGSIEHRIMVKAAKSINKKEAVISALKGSGVVILYPDD